MNWNDIQSNWNQYKAKVRENFSKLSDADLETTAGRRDQVLSKIQERYGYSRDVAEQKLNEFATKIETAAKAGAASRGTPGKKPEKV